MNAGLDGMARIELPSSAAPQARTGGTVVAVVGAAIVAAAWTLLPPDVFFAVVRVLLTAFGGAFVALGVAVGWAGVGAAVDREGGRLVLVWRAGPVRRRTVVPLDEVRRLRVGGGDDPTGRGPGWIEVERGETGERITFGFGQRVEVLRRLAAWIRDWSGLPPEVFAGLEAGEPLRPSAPHEGEVERALARLARSPRVAVARRDGRLEVELLPAGWGGVALGLAAAGVAGAALAVAFGLQVLRGSAAATPVPVALPLLLAVVPVALLVSAVHVARRRVRLAVADGALRIETLGPLGRRERWLRASAIADVRAMLLGGEGARWGLVVLGRDPRPYLTLWHPTLARRREEWEAVAVLLRDALAAPAG